MKRGSAHGDELTQQMCFGADAGPLTPVRLGLYGSPGRGAPVGQETPNLQSERCQPLNTHLLSADHVPGSTALTGILHP